MNLLGMEELNKNEKRINLSLPEYITNIDKLRTLVRYQTAPRVSAETVAEHSFFVAAYVLKLHDYYEFDLEKALKMAILHDFSEGYISDVPHPIKKAYPGIATALQQIEYNVNKDNINNEFADWLEEFNDMSSPEGIIVALADILSVVSYAKYEIGLGNSNYMKKVLEGAKGRYITVLSKAMGLEKEGITMADIFKSLEEFIK